MGSSSVVLTARPSITLVASTTGNDGCHRNNTHFNHGAFFVCMFHREQVIGVVLLLAISGLLLYQASPCLPVCISVR